jgi:hypothetical protein
MPKLSRANRRVISPVRIIAVALLGFGAAASPQMAMAALVTATITGTVSSGTDTTGVFIAPGSSFNNEGFTLVFNFDDSAQQISNTCGGPCATISGGTVNLSLDLPTLAADFGTAILTIGGNSYMFGGAGNTFEPANSLILYQRNYVLSPSSALFLIIDQEPGYNPGFGDGIEVGIGPALGAPPLTQVANWSSPFSDTQITTEPSAGASFSVDFKINNTFAGEAVGICPYVHLCTIALVRFSMP